VNALLNTLLVLVAVGQGAVLYQGKQHREWHTAHNARHDADDLAMNPVVEQVKELQEFLLHHPEEHAAHRARHDVDDNFGKPLMGVNKPPEWGG
jgi:uncharacterized protein HemX